MELGFKLRTRVAKEVEETTKVPLTITVGGVTKTWDAYTVGPSPVTGATTPYKWMRALPDDWGVGSQVYWTITIPNTRTDAWGKDLSGLVITDTPGEGLDMVCSAARPIGVYAQDEGEAKTYLTDGTDYTVTCDEATGAVVKMSDAFTLGRREVLRVEGYVVITDAEPSVYWNTGVVEADGPVRYEHKSSTRSQEFYQYASGLEGTVSVGDYVWLDADKDGIQDAGEKGIAGVTLRLTVSKDPTKPGSAVVLAGGEVVAPTTTDADGKYSFGGLPILNPGWFYVVEIDEAASAGVLDKYEPTTAGAGEDRAADSSTGFAASKSMTVKGDSDTTLDFGFVEKPVSPVSPSGPPSYVPPVIEPDPEEDVKGETPGGGQTQDGVEDQGKEQAAGPEDEESEKPTEPTVPTSKEEAVGAVRAPVVKQAVAQTSNPRPMLARTGVEAVGLIVAAGAALLSGSGLVSWRRRGEE